MAEKEALLKEEKRLLAIQEQHKLQEEAKREAERIDAEREGIKF